MMKNSVSYLIDDITEHSNKTDNHYNHPNLNNRPRQIDQTFKVIMTKTDLIDMCKQHGIRGYSKCKKPEIVELLKNYNVLHPDCNCR